MSNADARAVEIARAMLAAGGTGPAWGLELVDAGEGWARVAMTVTESMVHGHRITHGGMVFSLADSAFAYACNSRNVRAVPQSATIHFLRATELGSRLVAEAREIDSGGRSGTYLVTVVNEAAETVAVFHGLCRTIGGTVIPEDAEASPEDG